MSFISKNIIRAASQHKILIRPRVFVCGVAFHVSAMVSSLRIVQICTFRLNEDSEPPLVAQHQQTPYNTAEVKSR